MKSKIRKKPIRKTTKKNPSKIFNDLFKLTEVPKVTVIYSTSKISFSITGKLIAEILGTNAGSFKTNLDDNEYLFTILTSSSTLSFTSSIVSSIKDTLIYINK